jgi:hypothetical protein
LNGTVEILGHRRGRPPTPAIPARQPPDPCNKLCHASAEDLTRRVGDFEARLNRAPFVIADRLWVKDRLDPDEEKLRFSIWTRVRRLTWMQMRLAPAGPGPHRVGVSLPAPYCSQHSVSL